MGSFGFGGTSSPSGYTDNYVYVDGVAHPTGRAMHGGGTSCLENGLFGYCAGRGASRSLVMTHAGAGSTGSGTIASAGNGNVGTGWYSFGPYLVNGGSGRFTEDFSGSSYFARGGGGTSYDSYGTSFGGTLGGAVQYGEAPTAPQSIAISLPTGGAGQVKLDWAAPSDNGGYAITGYRITWWYDDDPGTTFDIDLGVVITHTWAVSPGKTVVARVHAKNAVTTAAAVVGVGTGTVSKFIPSGGKYWDVATASWKSGICWYWDTATASWKSGVVKYYDLPTTSWKNAQ